MLQFLHILMLQVTAQTRVSEVKEQLEKLLSVPFAQQKLLFAGRLLTGELKYISSNVAKSGTQLYLITKFFIVKFIYFKIIPLSQYTCILGQFQINFIIIFFPQKDLGTEYIRLLLQKVLCNYRVHPNHMKVHTKCGPNKTINKQI